MNDEYKSRPEFENMDVEISPDFHALDHSLLHCDNRRLHWQYAWEFKWSMQVKAATKCKIGLHESVQVHGRKAVGGPWFTFNMCVNCYKRLSAPQPE